MGNEEFFSLIPGHTWNVKVTQESRLLKVVGGICHFARVRVSAEPHHVLDIIEQLSEMPNQNDGEVNRQWEPAWVDAALQGCQEGVLFLRAQGLPVEFIIHLERVVGTLIDTIPADVFLAAFLATCQALHPDFDPPAFEFSEGKWVMKPSPIEGT